MIRFLEKGSKVKVTIMFRGREQSDYRFSAQFEHTIVITDDGNEILTVPDAHYFDGLDSFYAK